MKKVDDDKIKLLAEYFNCLDDSCELALAYIEDNEELDELITILNSANIAIHYFIKSKNGD